MAAPRWIFTKDQLANTPSRKSGIDADKELSYRQQAATLIQDMGQRLSVTQLCINTAIVYMHRFYMFQTFARFPRNEMAPACLFLAAKVEEQPRKLEHVIKVAHSCLHRDNTPAPDVKSEAYLEQAQVLVINENILLQTLGFDVTVDHPHTNVVKLTQLVKASKDLSQTSYFLATNSLHMTTFCLQYRPTVVACVCIYLACKWSNWKIPRSNEGKEWFQYIDRSVTQEMLEERYKEFLDILEKYPHKLRRKIMGWKGERTEGITKEDLEPGPSGSSFSSKHDYRKEMSLEQRKELHDRKEAQKSESVKREAAGHRNDQRDRPDSNESRHSRHGGPERKDGNHHPERKEQSHIHSRDPVKRKDIKEEQKSMLNSSTDRKSLPHTKSHIESNTENRSHSSVNHISNPKASVSDTAVASGKKADSKLTNFNDSPALPNKSDSQPNVTSEMHRSKSETTLNYKEYLKRKEQEKLEREKAYKLKAAESESLNESVRQPEPVVKTEKNRPPKLNISSNHHPERGSGNMKGNERPYEVNIKSPIKPHHSIKVKSPIKSSDLKQPKLEITKVQITPEKDGSDPFSVNVKTDPNLKKMVDDKKSGATSAELNDSNLSLSNHDRGDSHRVRVKPDPNSPRTRIKQENSTSPRIKVKLENSEVGSSRLRPERSERYKDKSAVGVLEVPEREDIQLLPEHTAAPNFKIRELDYDPNRSDSPGSAKLSGKYESGGSGRSTPVISQIKSEPGSGASPLKLKISISKGLKTEETATSSSQHSSPHGHKHKHKHKHKHSKDKHKDRDRHEHRDKHGTNGHSLKMSIKLSNLQGSDAMKHNKHDKQKVGVSDTSLSKNSQEAGDRQQPWSVNDLMTQSSSNKDTSRKRRRTPTVDQNNDITSHSKQAKVESHRLRRSSSSHSVVSMEMSDGDVEDHATNGPDKIDQPKVANRLQESLQQMIDQTNRKVLALQQQQRPNVLPSSRPAIDRQQSGFDLEGMMWSCDPSEQPPLPSDSLPPLPMTPPPRHAPPPPPPPP